VSLNHIYSMVSGEGGAEWAGERRRESERAVDIDNPPFLLLGAGARPCVSRLISLHFEVSLNLRSVLFASLFIALRFGSPVRYLLLIRIRI